MISAQFICFLHALQLQQFVWGHIELIYEVVIVLILSLDFRCPTTNDLFSLFFFAAEHLVEVLRFHELALTIVITLSVNHLLLPIVCEVLIILTLFDGLLRLGHLLSFFETLQDLLFNLLSLLLPNAFLCLDFVLVCFLDARDELSTLVDVDALVFLLFPYAVIVVLKIEVLQFLDLSFASKFLAFKLFLVSVFVSDDERVPHCQLFFRRLHRLVLWACFSRSCRRFHLGLYEV